jgi:hypothetical protein
LPKADHAPTHPTQLAKVLLVACSVLADFRLPKWRDLLSPIWKAVTVPKVAINEDSYFGGRKYDIGLAWEPRVVSPKVQPMASESSYDKFFKISILGANSGHAITTVPSGEVVSHRSLI